MRVLMRSRSAPPMSRFFPETRNGMTCLRSPGPSLTARIDRSPRQRGKARGLRCERLLLAPALNRRGYPHRLPVFCNRAARDADAGLAQPVDDCIVREHVTCHFGIDELLDAMPHRFRGMRLAAIGGGNR